MTVRSADSLRPSKQFVNALVALLLQDTNFIFEVATQTLFFVLFDRQRTLVFLLPLAGEHLHVDDRAVDARRTKPAKRL